MFFCFQAKNFHTEPLFLKCFTKLKIPKKIRNQKIKLKNKELNGQYALSAWSQELVTTQLLCCHDLLKEIILFIATDKPALHPNKCLIVSKLKKFIDFHYYSPQFMGRCPDISRDRGVKLKH